MSALLLIAAAVLILVGVVAYRRASLDAGASTYGRYLKNEWRRMPAELRTATLFASERDLSVVLDGDRIPVRPDQVYRVKIGNLVPVETKTRNGRAVYQYDVIELSLQRLALMERGLPVSNYGYVRLVPRDKDPVPQYRQVDLLDKSKVEALYRRYQGILAGDIRPDHQANPRACAGCGHRRVCPSSLA